MSGGGSGGGGNNTVTQVQQIPQYQQDFSQSNQDLARSLAANPYPQYQGQLVAGQTGMQDQGQQMAVGAANSYQPGMQNAQNVAQASLTGINPMQYSPTTPGAVDAFMSPYVQASLQPQIQNLQQQIAGQQLQNNAHATQANAFGDARQGVQGALIDHYGNQDLTNLVGQGYNTAYNNAVGAMGTQQQAALQEQGVGLQGAGALAGLAGQQQALGITGANAVYNAGAQQQALQQQQLNSGYQQFQNQAQWPYQMLNIRESALSNSPYSIANSTTVPNGNTTAQGIGTFASLAGALGSLGSTGTKAAA
jgi:hypothetical protein